MTSRIPASHLVADGATEYFINGSVQTITSVEFGPVWLNDEHTHLMAPEGYLLVHTSGGWRIPARPDTTFHAVK